MNGLLTRQKDCIQHLLKWKVGAVFMDAGTGKTRAAMEIVNTSPCENVIWIAPLRTLDNLKAEIAKWGGLKGTVDFFGVESIG